MTRIWHTTSTAAEYAGHHVQTIRKAAEAGELHGTQRTAGGRWRFHTECLDAWLLGDPCTHQVQTARSAIRRARAAG